MYPTPRTQAARPGTNPQAAKTDMSSESTYSVRAFRRGSDFKSNKPTDSYEEPKRCQKVSGIHRPFQMVDALHDFLPDHMYLICDETWFEQAIARFSGRISTDLVIQRQQIVIKQDCAGSHRVILKEILRHRFGWHAENSGWNTLNEVLARDIRSAIAVRHTHEKELTYHVRLG